MAPGANIGENAAIFEAPTAQPQNTLVSIGLTPVR